MSDRRSRLAREKKTIEAMINIYCHRQHNAGRLLCNDCQELLDYSRERLAKCPFQEGKPTCARCPVHCYNPAMRAQVRAVMRCAGPRMTYHHPLLTLFHFLDGRRDNAFVVSKKGINSDKKRD